MPDGYTLLQQRIVLQFETRIKSNK